LCSRMWFSTGFVFLAAFTTVAAEIGEIKDQQGSEITRITQFFPWEKRQAPYVSYCVCNDNGFVYTCAASNAEYYAYNTGANTNPQMNTGFYDPYGNQNSYSNPTAYTNPQAFYDPYNNMNNNNSSGSISNYSILLIAFVFSIHFTILCI
ncbi:hypothetical protein PMAYCL1PPCAC_27125, partial [Pristionchus mayeri]